MVLILIILIGMMGVGQTLHEHELPTNPDFDIYNFTDNASSKIWEMGQNLTERFVNMSYEDNTSRNVGRVYRIIGYYSGFVVGFLGETSFWGVEYGYEHPDLDFKTLSLWIVWLFVILIGVNLIVPILVLLWMFSKWLLKYKEE